MYQTMSLPLYSGSFEEYHGWGDLRAELAALGCDGMEGIWSGEEFPEDLPADLVIGYHLTFYPDWLDFYRDDRRALKRKFGSLDAAARFYGGPGPETLLEQYRADLRRAAGLNPHYVVFHVSDVSIEEGYTYHWLHTNQEVIDAAVEVINLILGTETLNSLWKTSGGPALRLRSRRKPSACWRESVLQGKGSCWIPDT